MGGIERARWKGLVQRQRQEHFSRKGCAYGKGRSCQGWRGVAARRKSTRQVTGRDREAPTDSLVRADGGLFRGGSQKG